jgi:hypothetical protein
MAHVKLTAVLLLAFALAVLCVALNPDSIVIEFGVITLQMRQGVALILMMAIGLLLGVALQAKWIAELLAERGRLRRALKSTEAKLRAD